MPRMARVVVPGVPHHVTQRGNRREDVFHADADRQRYLALLADYAAAHGLVKQTRDLSGRGGAGVRGVERHGLGRSLAVRPSSRTGRPGQP